MGSREVGETSPREPSQFTVITDSGSIQLGTLHQTDRLLKINLFSPSLHSHGISKMNSSPMMNYNRDMEGQSLSLLRWYFLPWPLHFYSFTNGTQMLGTLHLAKDMPKGSCPRTLHLRWATLRVTQRRHTGHLQEVTHNWDLTWDAAGCPMTTQPGHCWSWWDTEALEAHWSRNPWGV